MKRLTNQIITLFVKRWWIVVGIAMLATLLLVLFLGKGQDVWFDENYSIILAKQSVVELFRLTGVDAHPPLFYLLLKAWGETFGWTELSLRSLSAILASLTVGVVVLLVRTLFTTRVALASLPFLVLAPFWLRFGYEIRMYALAGFIGALASLVLIKAVSKQDKRWWVLYAVLVAAGMYTLYMTVVLWLAHFVWLVIYHRKNFWRQPWVWSYGGAAVLLLPYLPTIFYQYTHSALPGIGKALNLTHMNEVVSMIVAYTPEWSVTGGLAILILAAIVLVSYLFDRIKSRLSASSRRSLVFLMCLALVPPIFFALVSLPLSQQFFIPRYLAHTVLYIYALLGVVVALGWHYGYRKASAVLAALLLGLLTYGVTQLSSAGNFNFERMERPQTFQVRQQIDCSKSVLVADDAYTYINNEYYFGNCDMRFYSKDKLWFSGGYAWLSGSDNRLADSRDLTTNRLVHMYWKNEPVAFQPDERYRLVSSVTHDQQVTDTYELRSQ